MLPVAGRHSARWTPASSSLGFDGNAEGDGDVPWALSLAEVDADIRLRIPTSAHPYAASVFPALPGHQETDQIFMGRESISVARLPARRPQEPRQAPWVPVSLRFLDRVCLSRVYTPPTGRGPQAMLSLLGTGGSPVYLVPSSQRHALEGTGLPRNPSGLRSRRLERPCNPPTSEALLLRRHPGTCVRFESSRRTQRV